MSAFFGTSVDGAGPRPARVAARAAAAGAGAHAGVVRAAVVAAEILPASEVGVERVGRLLATVRRERREQFLEVGTAALRAGGLLVSEQQLLEPLRAPAARVLVQGHGDLRIGW